MTEQMKSIVEKIKKLLALKASPNEHEAALAGSMATELLDKYNLTMSEVEGSQAEVSSIIDNIDRSPRVWVRIYHITLFTRLAKMFDCFPYVTQAKRWTGKTMQIKKHLSVVGHATDVEVFLYTYQYLLRAVERICKEHIKAKELERGYKLEGTEREKFRSSFCWGAAVRVAERMEMKRAERLQQDNKCTALVLVRMKKVEDAVARMHPDMKQEKQRQSTINTSVYLQGKQAGDAISLHEGIKGKSTERTAIGA